MISFFMEHRNVLSRIIVMSICDYNVFTKLTISSIAFSHSHYGEMFKIVKVMPRG